jgi:hypothetical protein
MRNWSYWGKLLSVPLWHAIALSLDTEPTDTRAFAELAESEEYRTRLKILLNHYGRHPLLQRLDFLRQVTPNSEVILRDFAAWAEETWPGQIPTELKALAPPRQGLEQERTRFKTQSAWRKEEIERLNAVAVAETGEAATQHENAGLTQQLEPRAETTYLNVIGGLVQILLGDERGKGLMRNGTKKSIIDRLSALKKRGLAERTLHDVLKNAKERADPAGLPDDNEMSSILDKAQNKFREE